MFPLFDQAQLQLGDIMNAAAVHTRMHLSQDPVVYRIEVRTVGWTESWSDKICVSQLTAAQSQVPYGQDKCHFRNGN